ncbi:hypothetical protein VP01_2891g3 [Puccinia sorghi]|uniref:Uncharacterized protein n=1 Tax=Puccinia sorghi TaxID=27349 RepID=A0A0L6V3G0_9BASI|nr:hypothetical protein VP01_2891g3 [Puccinia sorghi]
MRFGDPWEASSSEFIKAHPQCRFGKFMGKSFPFYDLAHQVFSRTFSRERIAPEEIPNSIVSPGAKNSPPVLP